MSANVIAGMTGNWQFTKARFRTSNSSRARSIFRSHAATSHLFGYVRKSATKIGVIASRVRLAVTQPCQKHLDVFANARAMCPHLGELGLRHEIGEAALEVWPFLSSRPPFIDVGTVGRPHVQQAKISKPRDIGHQVDVCERRRVAEEPRPAFTQRRFHMLESALKGIY